MSQYCIYQLPVEKEYTFRDWEEVKGRFHFSDYKQVYKGELVDSVQYGEKITPCNKDDRSVLEDLYVKFNVNHPEDFTGRSLSVSDIVAVIRKDGTKYYYCDSFGWEDISNTVSPVVKSIYRVLVHDAEEQASFCEELSKYGFHWMSGQSAEKIPVFLKLSGNLGQIMNLNIHEKKIGFLPIEVYKNDPKAYGEILNSCISAEETLNIIKEELL